ncbi:MAG: hypothetical protein NTX56_05650, partial [Proteobacteria bacterium]|nr:hypothetical protein [Pseudomonadota bacterium]
KLAKAGARNSKADMSKIQTMHDHCVSLGADCGGAEKAAPIGDLEKIGAGSGDDLQKAIAAATEPLTKALAEASERIKNLEAQPMPATVRLRAVSKAADVGADDATLAKDQPEPIVDSGGNTHEVAGMLKQLHRQGGSPMLMKRD